MRLLVDNVNKYARRLFYCLLINREEQAPPLPINFLCIRLLFVLWLFIVVAEKQRTISIYQSTYKTPPFTVGRGFTPAESIKFNLKKRRQQATALQ